MGTKALLIVRSQIARAADRAPFDVWYRREHLPDTFAALRAERAWRSWSKNDPSVHWAFYEFPNIDTALEVAGSDAIIALSKKFDRVWGSRVIRTRDVVEVVQRLPNPIGAK